MKKCFTPKDKLWKVMKLCSIQAVVAMTLCSMAFAHDHYGQVLDKKITITLTEVSIEEALEAIEELTYAKFFYSVDQLGIEDKIGFTAVDEALGDLLDRLFRPYHIEYKVHEEDFTITLKRQELRSRLNDDKVRGDGLRIDEQATVRGTVRDGATGQAMAGVNVIIKGTTSGTTTDSEGNFSIWAAKGDFLVFSFIGYSIVEMEAGMEPMEILMQEDITKLKEITLNAGYWEVKDKEQTGNIVKVGSTDIQKQPVSNPLLTLQGRMTGVYVQEATGIPGGRVNIQIRGRNSLRVEGNDPLYLVNGIPFTATSLSQPSLGSGIVPGANPLNYLNPSDIESIEVLKDADATAVYGSRGANGVVLITTKKGVAGKAKVNIDLSKGIATTTSKIDLLNTEQYLEMRNEAFENDQATPGLNDYDLNGTWDAKNYTDWQKEFLGNTADVANLQASISGGNKQTQFFIGSTYFKETTVFPGDFSSRKGSLNTTIQHSSPNGRMLVSLSSTYSVNMSNLPGNNVASRITLPPNAPNLYNQDGTLNWANGSWGFSGNPVAALSQPYDGKSKSLLTNGSLSYELIPGLLLKSQMGFSNLNLQETRLVPAASQNPAFNPKGLSFYSTNNIDTWIVEPQVSYTKKFGDLNLNGLVGSTFQENISDSYGVSGSGFASDAMIENLSAAPAKSIFNSDSKRYRYHATFGRLNLNYKARYHLNLTGRRDGSSRFGPNKQFANFAALGAAWIFTNEHFLLNSGLLSFGKVRLSYGSTGSDQIGDYRYLDSYSATTHPYQGGVGLYPTRIFNPDYGWEINRKFEVGLELGLFENRIQSTVSIYRNKSSNQLVGYPLPDATGFTTVQFNLPATVENTGWEIEFNTTNIHRKSFKWDSYFNLTIPRNRLIAYPDLEASTNSGVYKVGEPLTVRRLFHYTGIDPTTGSYTVKDSDSDGVVSFSADRSVWEDVSQSSFGGFENRFSYGGLQFDVLFQFVKQTVTNPVYDGSFQTPGLLGNQPVQVMDRWLNEGSTPIVQKYTTGRNQVATIGNLYHQFSDHALMDGSYIRLKSISVSWQLPGKWFQNGAIQHIRLYALGQNILTITKYIGDPETLSVLGVPTLKRITCGLSIGL